MTSVAAKERAARARVVNFILSRMMCVSQSQDVVRERRRDFDVIEWKSLESSLGEGLDEVLLLLLMI